ncbi:MAG: tetratricopeptide repeat protein [Balneolaceae bacterium]|nr:tetratricopeptide repeat protein [Balneolaceae bacterium]
MKSYKPFLLIIALAGLFWACETTDPFVNEVQLSIFTGDYETALATVDEAIAENEANHVAHYYRGIVLAAQAESLEDPAERRSYYERARESFMTSRGLMEGMEETPDEYEELNDAIVVYWADEYNAGVNFQTDDSLFNATPDPLRVSLAHFHNAATINPDSAMTFQVMSSTYFQLEEVDDAISSYEKAMSLLNPPEVDDFEYLASLYLFQERFDDAIRTSEEALEIYPDESVFVQFMADAYIQAGDQERAIALVEDLIANDPENPTYRRVLGTQIYQTVDGITAEVAQLYERQFDLRQAARNQRGEELDQTQAEIEQLDRRIDEMEAEIDELTQISVREMRMVTELEPDSESAHFILGIIYQNRAANLFDRRNNTTDNQEAQDYDERARENLREALVYYERAAEINPDNPENWQSLYQVYVTLGMEAEAEEAMRRAGFDD